MCVPGSFQRASTNLPRTDAILESIYVNKIRDLISNSPKFQATFISNTCAFTSSAGPLRGPYIDSLGPPPGVGCILQHQLPLWVTLGGDILCCHLPWGSLRVPYMKRVRGISLGVFLFLLLLIQQQSYLSLGILSGSPQVLSQYAVETLPSSP